MATIGNISIGLSARMAGFERGLSRGRRLMRRFGRAASRVSRRILTLGGAISGAALIGGLTIFTKRSFESIDATAKLSDRLGMATERLSGLQHAAEITGAGTAALNKGLGFLEKSIGEAAQGIGEARYGLDRLGLTVEEIIDMPTDEKFATIAERMAGLTSASEKAFVATKLFGRGGLALINTLNLGSEGLEKMQLEAEKLGIAFNRVDAAKVEMANDAITRMRASFTGVFHTLAIRLAPFVTELADRITAFGVEGEGAGIRVSKAFDSVARGVQFVTNGIDLLRMGWHSLMAVGRRVLQVYTKGVETLLTVLGKAASVSDRIFGTNFKAKIDTATESVRGLSKAFGEQAGAAEAEVLLAWDRVKSRDLETRTRKWMEATQKRAAAAAERIAQKAAPGTAGPGAGLMGAGKRGRPGQFRVGSIFELALGGRIGAAKPVEVRSSQTRETNALLSQLIRTVQHAPPVAG